MLTADKAYVVSARPDCVLGDECVAPEAVDGHSTYEQLRLYDVIVGSLLLTAHTDHVRHVVNLVISLSHLSHIATR